MLRLARDSRGIAVVEFALVLPLMLIMLIGAFTISDMISAYRKVTITTRALTDLVSRNISPAAGAGGTTVGTYLTSSELVMQPYSATSTTVQVSELRVCDATHAWVVWTQAQTGTTAATSTVTASTVVTIPTSLVTGPMVPTSPDGSDVCNNTTAAANKTKVGTAGGYLFYGQVWFSYVPPIGLGAATTSTLGDSLYMIPRLN